MTADLPGKVAFVTGAARGQGRAHAVRLSRCGDDTATHIAGARPASGSCDAPPPDDSAGTGRLGGANARRVVCATADTRDLAALSAAVDDGVRTLGGLDVIVANAGICCPSPWD